MNLCTKGIKTRSGGVTIGVFPPDGADRERRHRRPRTERLSSIDLVAVHGSQGAGE